MCAAWLEHTVSRTRPTALAVYDTPAWLHLSTSRLVTVQHSHHRGQSGTSTLVEHYSPHGYLFADRFLTTMMQMQSEETLLPPTSITDTAVLGDGSCFVSRYLSPHKVALVVLVEIYCAVLLPPRHTTHVLSLVIDHIDVKDGIQLTLQQLQTETQNCDSSILGRTVCHLLLKKLWDIHSFDDFNHFMYALPTFLVQRNTSVPIDRRLILLSITSVLGRFIRRCSLEFNRMTFEESVHFWKAFIAYRASSMDSWNSLEGNHSMINVTSDLEGFADHPQLVEHVYKYLEPCTTIFDSDRFAENAVQNMQRTGNPLPDEFLALSSNLRLPQEAVPASTHYMKFIHSWKSGDYQATFDNLHRYFDYTLQNRDRRFYHYALLNLALVQADFGSTQEATWAIQESINTARENKDYDCLNFALAWLHQFQKSHPNITQSLSDQQIIKYLTKQSQESTQHGLQSSTHLFQSKKIIEEGGPARDAFKALLKSSKINSMESKSQLHGIQTLLCSDFWERLGVNLYWVDNRLTRGHNPTGIIHMELVSMHYSHIISSEDLIRIRCNHAIQCSKRGRLPELIASLQTVGNETQMSNQTRKIWALYVAYLQIRLSLNRSNLNHAFTIFEQVSPLLDIDRGLRLLIKLLEVEYLKRSHDLPQAFDSVVALKEEYGSQSDILDRITIEVSHAELILETEEPWKALSLISRQVILAEKHKLPGILSKAIVVLSEVLLRIDEAEEALILLDGVMALEDEGLEGRALDVYAECLVEINQKKHNANHPEETALLLYERALDGMFLFRILSDIAAYRNIEDIEQSIRISIKVLQNAGLASGKGNPVMENALASLQAQREQYSKQSILTPVFTYTERVL
ncbi:Anaphase-promoting complex subunit 5 [Neolecta irregularis DAH-3]|uniref:Anaphase-promoting complex subunit 5 n=1 Tax=Neolecta irregularis (strain DAH-3) TaxID=1198029 RepID=A0A1U7LHL3_NEOID|nr:Anaphase-promoting complex subunit 5 [Neolecta irregularis DAH-3]|eukprot:OLL22083.1 Anaphase-promoting complex subunit 5 [Neolecta irregularis DAH-3]